MTTLTNDQIRKTFFLYIVLFICNVASCIIFRNNKTVFLITVILLIIVAFTIGFLTGMWKARNENDNEDIPLW